MHTALIIGAGEISELTARHLATAGIKKMYFANRTLENAILVAEKFGGTALLLNERDTIMPDCDIVISSTGSPHFIITSDQVKKVMGLRNTGRFFLSTLRRLAILSRASVNCRTSFFTASMNCRKLFRKTHK